ncbi:hypothetical protein Dimus_029099, partial [Dionaea muscipula]
VRASFDVAASQRCAMAQATEDLSKLLDGGLGPLTDPFPGGPEDVSLLRCFRTQVVAYLRVAPVKDRYPYRVFFSWQEALRLGMVG